MPKKTSRRSSKSRSSKPANAAPQSSAIVVARQQAILSVPEKLEAVLIKGDLAELTPADRVDYYRRMCNTLGLNFLTHPFDYILFREPGGGQKLSLYANKSCTEQLRYIHGVSVIPESERREVTADNCIVDLALRDRTGRTDTGQGVVALYKFKDGKRVNLDGAEYANAIMKTHTKAKRRGTLSICGLAMLDESELDNVEVLGGVTPDGRIYYHAGKTPEDEYRQKRVDAKAAQKQIVDAKIAEHESKRVNGATQEPVQETSAVPKANVPPKAPIDLAPTHTVTSDLPDSEAKGTIEVDWTADRKSPIVRGDIAEILPIMQKYCKLVWREDWWHCEITDVETLRQMAEQFSYKFVQILPNDPPPPPKQKRTSSAAVKESRAEEKPAPAGEKKERPKAAEPVLVKGVIENHVEKMTRKNQPMMSVLLKTDKGKVWYSVFDNDLFPFISKAKGREGEFFTTEGNYPTIKGFKTLAGKEFTDGKLPVIQRSAQEAGQRTLY